MSNLGHFKTPDPKKKTIGVSTASDKGSSVTQRARPGIENFLLQLCVCSAAAIGVNISTFPGVQQIIVQEMNVWTFDDE